MYNYEHFTQGIYQNSAFHNFFPLFDKIGCNLPGLDDKRLDKYQYIDSKPLSNNLKNPIIQISHFKYFTLR